MVEYIKYRDETLQIINDFLEVSNLSKEAKTEVMSIITRNKGHNEGLIEKLTYKNKIYCMAVNKLNSRLKVMYISWGVLFLSWLVAINY